MKNAPIIFCHYGFSKYLPYVFECAKISNPNKEIILLGDKSNQAVASKYGVRHVNLSDYDFGEDLKEFDQSYKLIVSPSFDSYKHGEDWNKFVFRKWFILHNFLIKENIERFWHFDSDNMIFVDLEKVEWRYKDIDFTEQSSGNCIKGYFGNTHSIEKYNKKINEVFARKDFIKKTEDEMKKLEGPCSFNEMSVYGIFKQEENFRTTWLARIVDGTFFDDLICLSQGMKMEKLALGEDSKVVHLNPDGRFFCIEESSGKPIEAYLLNLSWIPIYIFDAVLKHFKSNHKKPKADFNPRSKTLSQISPPLKQRLKHLRKKIKMKISRKK
jgi:hypothetical protein